MQAAVHARSGRKLQRRAGPKVKLKKRSGLYLHCSAGHVEPKGGQNDQVDYSIATHAKQIKVERVLVERISRTRRKNKTVMPSTHWFVYHARIANARLLLYSTALVHCLAFLATALTGDTKRRANSYRRRSSV